MNDQTPGNTHPQDEKPTRETIKGPPLPEGQNTGASAPLRALMDLHNIHLLEMVPASRFPQDFDYYGSCQIIEVRFEDHSAFCRYEDFTQEFFGWERWEERFPDREARIFFTLISAADDIHWYRQHGRMKDWLYAYGEWKNDSQNRHEWSYACRAADDLVCLFGEDLYQQLKNACKRCEWDTEGL